MGDIIYGSSGSCGASGYAVYVWVNDKFEQQPGGNHCTNGGTVPPAPTKADLTPEERATVMDGDLAIKCCTGGSAG